MGGQFEGKISVVEEPKSEESNILAAPTKPTKSLLPEQTQEIRHHLDPKTNQVHLHTDGIKVAMPPVRLEMILSELRDRKSNEISFYDPKNKSLARFKSGINSNGQFDIWLNLETVEFANEGPVVKTLDKFLSKMVAKK